MGFAAGPRERKEIPLSSNPNSTGRSVGSPAKVTLAPRFLLLFFEFGELADRWWPPLSDPDEGYGRDVGREESNLLDAADPTGHQQRSHNTKTRSPQEVLADTSGGIGEHVRLSAAVSNAPSPTTKVSMVMLAPMASLAAIPP